MYEGALRQACIARWPGVIPAGTVCDEPWAFWDFLPTCAEILNTKLPDGVTTDGLSILPLLEGGSAPKRASFYWELHEGPTIQAARFGDIKAVRNGPSAAVEIYDLSKDVAERNDLAKDRPDLVAQAEKIMQESRVDDPNWPVQGKRSSGKSEKMKSR
jgi:arylsulfatase A-like enzyme